MWEKTPSIQLCKISRYILRPISWLVSHVSHLSHKLVKTNAMLCKLHHYVNKATIKSVYYAIFHSHLSYVCTAWGKNLNPKHCINLLQQKDIQIISFAQYDAHIIPISAKLNITTFSDLILLCNCLFIYHHFSFFTCFHTSIKYTWIKH